MGLGLWLCGKPHTGSRGLVEGGHSVLVPGGLLCACGQRGCAEMYVSARAVGARYCERVGLEAGSTDAERVFALASVGDCTAIALIDEVCLRTRYYAC